MIAIKLRQLFFVFLLKKRIFNLTQYEFFFRDLSQKKRENLEWIS